MRKFQFLLTFIAVCMVSTALASPLESNLKKHVKFLADDKQEGRGIGTKGLDESAQYIADRFQELGLQPPFGGSYFQPFEMGWGVQLGPNNRVQSGDTGADTSSGIMPIGFSSAGTVTAPVVFVGYGITAPEFNYDDFADMHVDSAIILCLTGEPGEFDSSSVFEGVNYTAHATLRSKASNAKLKNAVAMLVVEGPLYAGTGVEELAVPRADEPYLDCGIPALRITREALARLFPEFELEKLQRSIDSNTQPRSMQITDSVNVTLTADLTRETVAVKNVVGLIPGNDTVIVVGAHYDHLGFGQSGSLDPHPGKIHNGADDNASGVASVIEIARDLMSRPIPETVMLATFTAEETGLGGSSHLVKNFPLRLDLVRAMINLDMVGRVKDNQFSVLGCKSADEFSGIIEDANQSIGLNVTCKGDGYGPSDHMNFYLADRPVLFFFSGAHEDYHRSTDDYKRINFDDMARVTRLAENTVRGISKFSAPLTFVKSSEPPPQGGGRFRAWFGSIPDYSQADTLIGVLLSGVRSGSPAESAGLTGGDLMVQMGKVKLNNIYDLVFALRTYAPGDSADVHYLRKGAERSSVCVFGSPPK
ncbi:M20/M25/M40 family metallo-hydrolase [candidate division KSB1 bacterium]|nr:M20/M25/M40 family metallo-hydrolase [candidate division KSB1 bacterium]